MPNFSHETSSTILRTLHHRLLLSMKPISPSRSIWDGSCEKHLISGVRSDSNEEVLVDKPIVGVQWCSGEDVAPYNRFDFVGSVCGWEEYGSAPLSI